MAQLGNASFGAQYDASNWTGEVVASELNFAADGTPSLVERWRAKNTLATQLAGTGWGQRAQPCHLERHGRCAVPHQQPDCGATRSAEHALSGRRRTTDINDSDSKYLNYLRGDRSNEATSTVTGSSRAYHTRARRCSATSSARAPSRSARVVPAFADGLNPGYDAFKTLYKNRATVVYVGANDGILHAFNGAMSGAGAGTEIFGYIPNALFAGPSSPSAPAVDGLAVLGNTDMDHHFLVNATPGNFDVDFTARTTARPSAAARRTGTRSLSAGWARADGRTTRWTSPTRRRLPRPPQRRARRWLRRRCCGVHRLAHGFTYGEPVFVKTRAWLDGDPAVGYK